MDTKPFTARLTAIASWLIMVVLICIPFYAFLTVWLSSIFGHYTLLRLWKEIVLVILAAKAAYLIGQDGTLRVHLRASRLNQLIIAYLVLLTLCGGIAYLTHHVTAKALGYGLIVDGRFFVFFIVVSVFARSSPRLKSSWPMYVMAPAILVILFGLGQYFVLPSDVLRHVGYNQTTIFPYETINHNQQYIRIMSTLRGANPLGAYLVVILSLLAALWLKLKSRAAAMLGVLATVALAVTFSRSAWIGLVLAAGTVLWASLASNRSRRIALSVSGGLLITAVFASVLLQHNNAFQNALFHTDDHSKIAISSNQGHASALRAGLHDVAHQPLGAGPGSAGPASVYNQGHVRIAENYFVQIAQETGWLGVGLFIAIQLLLGRELWRLRADTLALGLLAALVGVSLVNVLSHAWADDTLAYIFWGLAAVALTPLVHGSPIKSNVLNQKVAP